MWFEPEYEEKMYEYGDFRVATLDSESPASKLVVAKTIKLRVPSERLARELKVWAGLQHPHVLPVVGYHLEKSYTRAVLISDYIVRGNLWEYVEREKPSWDLRLRIVRDLADGLTYLHQLDPPFPHGKLKPGNVLINAERRGMLTDFSLSKALEDVPEEGLKGAPRYYSPGLIKETETHYALPSDVWALGCLLLEVLAERTPYAEKKAQVQILRALVNDELPAEIESLSLLTSDLKLLLAKCWAIQPAERPSASDCLRILNLEVHTSSSPDHAEGGVHETLASFKAASSTDEDATLGKGIQSRYSFMTLENMLKKYQTRYTITEKTLNEKENTDWVTTITVNGIDYTSGPTNTKLDAKEAAAEKALRALGWV
ncbi:hypothetical protein FRC01_010979 [Tulasnella sp. 417]|nr:hypothetical protein FRC01_010979 [Tulasnella sp. 417]